jgi:MFS family permease
VKSPRIAPASTAAFHHRAFRVYWFAQLVSYLGTYMQQVALGYLVYDLSSSKWLLGVVGALSMAPSLVLALPAGVLADRVRRRNLVLCTQSSAVVLAFSLASLLALHQLQIWEILVISTLSGVAIAVEMPARQALVVELVGKQDLSNAIAWNSLVFNGSRVVGPAIGGLVITYVGIAPIFFFNSASFLAVIAALLTVQLPAIVHAPRRRPWEEFREGMQYLAASPSLMTLLAFLAVIATLVMNFNVIMPIFARDILHGGAEGLGWMWTAMGIGAVLGSFTVVRWSQAAVGGRLLITSALVAGVSELAMAFSRSTPATLAILVAVGWSIAAFSACTNSAIQARVDDAVRGRVVGVYSMFLVGSGPLGSLVTAALAGAGGAPLPLAVAGIACTIAAVASARWFIKRLSSDLPYVPTSAVARQAS